MKTNKKLRIAAVSVLGTVLLLFVVLVAHIAMAKPVDNAHMQISRIDFDGPLDSAQIKDIHRNLKSIPGIMGDHFKPEAGVLVYFSDNRITNSKKVFDQLISKGNYKAKPFTIPDNIANKPVCPVMDHDGFSYKFTQTIQKIIN